MSSSGYDNTRTNHTTILPSSVCPDTVKVNMQLSSSSQNVKVAASQSACTVQTFGA